MRLRLISTIFLMAAALASAVFAQEAGYPTHAVRLIVASGPGGNPDVLGRILAERMTQDFGAAFVVENVTGAGGALAAITDAKAPPDGYTLLSGDSGSMAINPVLNPELGYDPMTDFTP